MHILRICQEKDRLKYNQYVINQKIKLKEKEN